MILRLESPYFKRSGFRRFFFLSALFSSEKSHGVQALACRLGSHENGSHKLKLELHAFFHSFSASQRDIKAPPKTHVVTVINPAQGRRRVGGLTKSDH